MPVLGYGQVSSIAPNAISAGYAGIVKNLQQTGQEIAANVQRVQTNKQVQAMGQELSTVDPYSPTFPQQMLAVATKYPMALADQRGQALMGMLGIAHKDYLAQKMDLTNFAQQKELAGMQHGFRMEEIGAKPGFGGGFASDKFGRIYSKKTGEVVQDPLDVPQKLNEGQGLMGADGQWIVPPIERTTATPYGISGGMVVDKTTGGFSPLPLNANQQATLDQKGATEARQQAIGQIKVLDDDIARAIAETRDTEDEGRLRDLQNRIDNARSRKDALLNALGGVPVQGPSQGAIDPLSTPSLGGLNGIKAAPAPVTVPVPVPVVPDASVLPPPGAIPASPKNSGPSWKKYLP